MKIFKKINEIYIFETFLCLFVIYIHLVSEPITLFQTSTIISSLFLTTSKLVSYVVPAFIFSSGIKLFNKFEETNFSYISFISDRLKKIYVPYILWVIIYYLYFVFFAKYFSFDVKELFFYTLSGDLVAHFYFIIIIMQMYILLPLFIFYTKKIPPKAGIPLAFAITIIFKIIVPKLFNITVPYEDRIFTSYFIYFISGAYFGIYYEKAVSYILKHKILIYLLYLPITIAHTCLTYLSSLGTFIYKYSDIAHLAFCAMSVITFYLFVKQLTPYLEKYLNFFKKAANASFYVYLSHILVILIVQVFLGDYDSITGRFLIKALFAYTVPFFLSSMYLKIKKSYTNISRPSAPAEIKL